MAIVMPPAVDTMIYYPALAYPDGLRCAFGRVMTMVDVRVSKAQVSQ